jgi:hypothetical protein
MGTISSYHDYMRDAKSRLRVREDGSRQADAGEVIKENWATIVSILKPANQSRPTTPAPQKKQG